MQLLLDAILNKYRPGDLYAFLHRDASEHHGVLEFVVM